MVSLGLLDLTGAVPFANFNESDIYPVEESLAQAVSEHTPMNVKDMEKVLALDVNQSLQDSYA